MSLSSLSIFFPAYNDAKTLPSLVQRASEAAKKVTRDYEIIIVNDGSRDDTSAVVHTLQRRYPYLRLITHPQNRGYGGALISGFAAATKDWVFYTDGDGQYDPSELTLLVRAETKTIDVVNGYKLKRNDPWYRILIGNLYNGFMHMVYRLPIRDIDCDFRLIRRDVLKRVTLRSQSGAICLELITKLRDQGARFSEMGVHHFPRQFGQSQFFSVSRIVQTITEFPPPGRTQKTTQSPRRH